MLVNLSHYGFDLTTLTAAEQSELGSVTTLMLAQRLPGTAEALHLPGCCWSNISRAVYIPFDLTALPVTTGHCSCLLEHPTLAGLVAAANAACSPLPLIDSLERFLSGFHRSQPGASAWSRTVEANLERRTQLLPRWLEDHGDESLRIRAAMMDVVASTKPYRATTLQYNLHLLEVPTSERVGSPYFPDGRPELARLARSSRLFAPVAAALDAMDAASTDGPSVLVAHPDGAAEALSATPMLSPRVGGPLDRTLPSVFLRAALERYHVGHGVLRLPPELVGLTRLSLTFPSDPARRLTSTRMRPGDDAVLDTALRFYADSMGTLAYCLNLARKV